LQMILAGKQVSQDVHFLFDAIYHHSDNASPKSAESPKLCKYAPCK
jgi:hypothetical protein